MSLLMESYIKDMNVIHLYNNQYYKVSKKHKLNQTNKAKEYKRQDKFMFQVCAISQYQPRILIKITFYLH